MNPDHQILRHSHLRTTNFRCLASIARCINTNLKSRQKTKEFDAWHSSSDEAKRLWDKECSSAAKGGQKAVARIEQRSGSQVSGVCRGRLKEFEEKRKCIEIRDVIQSGLSKDEDKIKWVTREEIESNLKVKYHYLVSKLTANY